jgi:hypothetical protein
LHVKNFVQNRAKPNTFKWVNFVDTLPLHWIMHCVRHIYTRYIRRYWNCFHIKNLPTYTTICRSEAVASIFPSGENLATLTAD